jgi:membrane protein DedA with SNARE-associated domain
MKAPGGAVRLACNPSGLVPPAALDEGRNRAASRMFESLEAHAHNVVEFVRVHEAWAAPIVFVLAFGESLAFISLLVPAWAALVGIGVLISSGKLDFWPVWVAGSMGAALGDWLSYWIGVKLGPPVAHIWPLSRHPELLPKGEAFVKHWGALAIFIGRFFGPLRASVPLVAGIFRMPWWQFQTANFSSAFVWAAVLLTLGDVVGALVSWIWR